MSLRETVEGLRIKHHVSPDCWYTCPLAEDADVDERCCNDSQPGVCTCIAEAHNAKVDELLATLAVLDELRRR